MSSTSRACSVSASPCRSASRTRWQRSPPKSAAPSPGLSNLPSQRTSATGPPIAGYLFDHAGLTLPFDIAALLYGVNTLLFFIFFRNPHPPEERAIERESASVAAVPTRSMIHDGEQGDAAE